MISKMASMTYSTEYLALMQYYAIVKQVLLSTKQLALAAKFTSPWTCLLVV